MAEEREYGAPEQITPQVLGDYLDAMSKSVFQSGMSWRVVKAKWPGTREAFHNVSYFPGSIASVIESSRGGQR